MTFHGRPPHLILRITKPQAVAIVAALRNRREYTLADWIEALYEYESW
jgi:hypothetical protein